MPLKAILCKMMLVNPAELGFFSPTRRRKSKRTHSRRHTQMSSIGSSSLEELIWLNFCNLNSMSPLFPTLILYQLFPHHWSICKAHSYEWEDVWEVNVRLLSCPCFLRLEEMQTQPMAKIDVKAMWSRADWDDQFGHKHASCVTTDLEMWCKNVTWEGSQTAERAATAEGRKTSSVFSHLVKNMNLHVFTSPCLFTRLLLFITKHSGSFKKKKITTPRLACLWIPQFKHISWPHETAQPKLSVRNGKMYCVPWKHSI